VEPLRTVPGEESMERRLRWTMVRELSLRHVTPAAESVPSLRPFEVMAETQLSVAAPAWVWSIDR
jgi:hypothetical protein